LYEGVSIRECRLCYARRRGAPCRGRVWIVRVRDEVLLKRVASWGERALSDLYDHYASLVYGTGMRLPGDTEADPSGALSRRFDVATVLSGGIDPFRTGPSGRR
jgi:hypothetical protein